MKSFPFVKEQAHNLNLQLKCSVKMADFELAIKQGIELTLLSREFRGCHLGSTTNEFEFFVIIQNEQTRSRRK